jgi:ketosteroid isomerase-like protein
MSAQIETVKRVYELFNRLPTNEAERRANPETDELLGLFDNQVEFTQPAAQPEGSQVFVGRKQLRESWDRWFEMWEHHRSSLEHVDEAGNRVLALSRDHFRGRDGVELEQKGASIFTFDGPRIVRFEAFFDQATARRRLGSSHAAL